MLIIRFTPVTEHFSGIPVDCIEEVRYENETRIYTTKDWNDANSRYGNWLGYVAVKETPEQIKQQMK